MGHKQQEVVVITGASAGVGRATVREFAKRRAHIGLIARNKEALEAAKQEVERLGGRGLVVVADVADPKSLDQAAAQVEEEFGAIDVWVNNAMVSVFSPVMEMTAEEYQRVTNVTYLGYVYGTIAALRRMIPRDRGTIVQVGSALAYRGIPLQSAYCAAKHAVKGFTESLRTELIHDQRGIRLNMVHLPALNTPQFEWVKSRLPNHPQPVPPIFQPEVAARAIYWSAHHDRRELLVGWPTVRAIWGEKFIPGLIDKYLASFGYDGQQTDQADDPNRPNNLYEPVAGDFGARGRFGSRSSPRSLQAWIDRNRGGLLLGLGLLGAAIAIHQQVGSKGHRSLPPAA